VKKARRKPRFFDDAKQIPSIKERKAKTILISIFIHLRYD